MNAVITNDGHQLIVDKIQGGSNLNIDKIIVAKIDNRPAIPPKDFVKPTTGFVKEFNISGKGKIGNDKVVYSLKLPNTEGDYKINAVMLYSSEADKVVAVAFPEEYSKTKTTEDKYGNNVVENIILAFSDIAKITNITLDAEAWQYDAKVNPNLLINGNFKVWQRGESFTNLTKGTVVSLADKFNIGVYGTSSLNITKENGLKVKFLNSTTTGDNRLMQAVEKFTNKKQIYTVAVEMTGITGQLVQIFIRGYNKAGAVAKDVIHVMNCNGSKQLITKTGEMPADLNRIEVFLGLPIHNENNTLTIHSMKLEEGHHFTGFIKQSYAQDLLDCGPLKSGQYLTKDGNNFKWQGFNTAPVGSIILWGGTTPPDGYMECNGEAVNRNTYSSLFNKIGTTYGNGNNSTTFNIPDLRGEFVRGWDHGKGIDVDRQLGSSQGDEFKSHNHASWSSKQVIADYCGIDGNLATTNEGPAWKSNAILEDKGGSETRPRNVALMYCIKVCDMVTNPENIDIKKFLDDHEKNVAHHINPNLLINANFKVWQRGTNFTSSNLTSGAYSADRWAVNFATGKCNNFTKIDNGGCKINIVATGGSWSNTLRQKLEKAPNKAIATIKVKGTAGLKIKLMYQNIASSITTLESEVFTCNGAEQIFTASFNFSDSVGVDRKDLIIDLADYATGQVLEIYNVKLEEGDKFTGFTEQSYTLDLLESQRYCQILSTNNINFTDLRPLMRSNPTIIPFNSKYLYNAEL